MEQHKELRLAVLIDAENVPHSNIKEILQEIAKYGTPTIKRIYADWTKPNSNRWKDLLLENSITPIQQYSYTSGKNSSDSAMIIDAMDILYAEKVSGFCIISSDSDFTRLASRLREAGMYVIGIGEKKTPNPFIVACEKFIYIEILKQPEKEETKATSSTAIGEAKDKEATKKKAAVVPEAVVKLLTESINDLADDDGWVFLSSLKMLVVKKQSDFDPRNYGFQKFSQLINTIKIFEVVKRGVGSNAHPYVRIKV